MGITPTGEDCDGLGTASIGKVLEKAAELAPYKRTRSKGTPKKKRGGQPGNKNAGGGASYKKGLYANLVGVDRMTSRFQHYSKALGKASALEEVALTRAMIANLLSGKDPLGYGEMEDPELLAGYLRDFLILNLKAQERFEKQEAKRLEREEREGANGGLDIRFTAEAMAAMNGIADGQDVGVSAEELMAQARVRVDEMEAARAAAEAEEENA